MSCRSATSIFWHPGRRLLRFVSTSNRGRRHFQQRLAAVATTVEELREELSSFVQG